MNCQKDKEHKQATEKDHRAAVPSPGAPPSGNSQFMCSAILELIRTLSF